MYAFLSFGDELSDILNPPDRNPTNPDGLGKATAFHPDHHVERLTGMRAKTDGRRRKPVGGSSFPFIALTLHGGNFKVGFQDTGDFGEAQQERIVFHAAGRHARPDVINELARDVGESMLPLVGVND
jgi:hypothetical protein